MIVYCFLVRVVGAILIFDEHVLLVEACAVGCLLQVLGLSTIA